ncbi:Ldh family oxidoreductase [Kribbella shirazensis]|uniref:LDH2 family malate/lactate/ureidoglycolate dehydrogenase n=1 Tax=Kribbella shirazensis TaxID=1105143 RepID=A0A7X6A5M7_9ACTN|nr:LDH2 family malate/lactate/ureidoglycolate dehydrogenase [Kribbella shirazensis]
MSEEVATAERNGGSTDPGRLSRFTADVFVHLGMSDEDAGLLADYFVWVELHGVPAMGVRRIPEFVDRLRHGGTRCGGVADSKIVRDHPAFAVVDAQDTFAQLAGHRAMQIAVGKARATGLGAVSVRNTTTAGVVGYYSALAAEQQMIGLVVNNSAPVMAAYGAAERTLGVQALSMASPAGEHPPLLLDMTNSAMSMARMYEHQLRREQLPGNVALSADGTPTIDPEAGHAGILLPMAGHRGYGLALMWEVLVGVLAGGQHFGNDVRWPSEHALPSGNSLFVLAVDPAAALPYETFTGRVDTLIDRMHDARPAAGVDRVLVPGERSQIAARARRREGIVVPDDVVASLVALGSELGVAW